jgi:hypothetical protein
MSDYRAIAAVTTTLQNILYDAVSTIIPQATVTTLRPEKASNGNQNNTGLNLYLYQVMPNAAYRNTDIVFRWHDQQKKAEDRATDRIKQYAQIPLNLHYLLSFYGDDTNLVPQLLLGRVVSVIEARPILSPGDIHKALNNNEDLKNSNLEYQAENIEHIKLSSIPLSLEDLSKLWSVFFQVPYVLSVAYEVSVVLIETSSILPVHHVITERNIDASPDNMPEVPQA